MPLSLSRGRRVSVGLRCFRQKLGATRTETREAAAKGVCTMDRRPGEESNAISSG